MIPLSEYPLRAEWKQLINRPQFDRDNLDESVRKVLDSVRTGGDQAVREWTRQYEHSEPGEWEVSREEMAQSARMIPDELQSAIRLAASNIERFHRSQVRVEEPVETMKGVRCWRKSVPIARVGLYIPGGTAPLFSTVLMLGIPARIAGCPEIILCTPAGVNGAVAPAILFAAHLLGIHRVFRVGGAQAIAAMTFGTESIPQVDKLFGPGNQYVTKAKEIAQQWGVAIDMPAGPSEVLIIADDSANPDFVAADLLSQAEHGTDSQVMLVSTSRSLVERTQAALANQLEVLPRRDIASAALKNSRIILLGSVEECMDFSNQYAPEHLIISTENAAAAAEAVVSAGSVFLGKYSCESAGDYASGTNHTLPTYGFARSYSGVSVDSFVKKITFQEISPEGLMHLGPAVEIMAESEQLRAHANAVAVRLKSLRND